VQVCCRVERHFRMPTIKSNFHTRWTDAGGKNKDGFLSGRQRKDGRWKKKECLGKPHPLAYLKHKWPEFRARKGGEGIGRTQITGAGEGHKKAREKRSGLLQLHAKLVSSGGLIRKPGKKKKPVTGKRTVTYRKKVKEVGKGAKGPKNIMIPK